jgi:hypothetical protein
MIPAMSVCGPEPSIGFLRANVGSRMETGLRQLRFCKTLL